jgi:hypothetical protein
VSKNELGNTSSYGTEKPPDARKKSGRFREVKMYGTPQKNIL